MDIWDDGYEDLERLRRPFSLTTPPKELKLKYFMFYAPENRSHVSQVINRTFPTIREEGGRGSTTDLVIHLYKDRDIRLLLESLTVAPLREIRIHVPPGTKIDDVEGLKTLARERGLGTLYLSGVVEEEKKIDCCCIL
ncbi:uncharacterized protein LOC135204458 [Macrobrachium nipponense]|uniref:uncharacterized protein LOC135204458 n=1 Tax=Macrobrachium nipponense TaxID=159736 RepID=UPI0030C87FF3